MLTRIVFLVCFLFAAFAAAENISPTLADWDRTVDKAKDFADFMARPELQEELFLKMQAYYGAERFHRDSFNVVLKQLAQNAEKVDGFGAALFKKRNVTKPFSVTYDVGQTSSPYVVNQTKWIERLNADIAKYEAGAAGLLALTFADRKAAIADRVTKLQAEIAATQRRINEAPDGDRKRLREEFKQELKNRPELKELIAFALHTRLTDHSVADALRSGDGDNVVEALREVQGQYREAFRAAEFGDAEGMPAILREMAREAAPNAQKLLANPELFEVKPAKGQETTTFYGVHRALYSAFRGVPLGECIGGSSSYLDKTTALRHAVPVLAGAEVQFAEVNGKWSGFTEQVPVKNRRDGKVYGSVILGHSKFKTPIYVADKTGQRTKTSLFEQWLDRTPKPEGGILIGESNDGDNAKVLPSVRGSRAYALGEDVGDATDFEHTDANRKMVKDIVANNVDTSFGYGARKAMIFDATLPGAGRLVCLFPIQAADYKDRMREFLTGSDGLMKRRALDYLLKERGELSRFENEVRALLKDAERPIQARAELLLLKPSETEKIFDAHVAIAQDPLATQAMISQSTEALKASSHDAVLAGLKRNPEVKNESLRRALAHAYLRSRVIAEQAHGGEAGANANQAHDPEIVRLAVDYVADDWNGKVGRWGGDSVVREQALLVMKNPANAAAAKERLIYHLRRLNEPGNGQAGYLLLQYVIPHGSVDADTLAAIVTWLQAQPAAREDSHRQDLELERFLLFTDPKVDPALRDVMLKNLKWVNLHDGFQRADEAKKDLFAEATARLLTASDPEIRHRAVGHLGWWGYSSKNPWHRPEIFAWAVTAATQDDHVVAAAAVRVLASAPKGALPAGAVEAATTEFRKARPATYYDALKVLEAAGVPKAELLPYAFSHLDHPDQAVRNSATTFIAEYPGLPWEYCEPIARAASRVTDANEALRLARLLNGIAARLSAADRAANVWVSWGLMALLKRFDDGKAAEELLSHLHYGITHVKAGYVGIEAEYKPHANGRDVPGLRDWVENHLKRLPQAYAPTAVVAAAAPDNAAASANPAPVAGRGIFGCLRDWLGIGRRKP